MDLQFIGLILYRLIAWPVGTILCFLAIPFSRKIRVGVTLRLNRSASEVQKLKSLAAQRPWWIHAASGEYEYAKPLIQKLKAKDPRTPVVVTYFSDSYIKNIKADVHVDASTPLPFDFPGAMASFVQNLNPRALLISRTDLWPECLYQCRRHKVPTLIFSARASEHVFFKQWIQKWLFKWLDNVFVVSDVDQADFSRWHSSVQHMGDTRYDQVFARLESPKPIKSALFAKTSALTIVAGSTWPEDEKVLLESAAEHVKKQKINLVLVPHETNAEHLNHLQNLITKSGLESELYSKVETRNPHKVLIVDVVGILAELYAFADLCYVGGSFRQGVHSVLEPLAYGKITIVGPQHKNSREAVEFSTMKVGRHHAIQVIDSKNDLSHMLHDMTASEASIEFAQAQKMILAKMHTNKGATDRIAGWITQNYH